MQTKTAAAESAADAAFRREFGDAFFDRLLAAQSRLGDRGRLLQVRRPADRARREGACGPARAGRALAQIAAPNRLDEAEPEPARGLGDPRECVRDRSLGADRAALLAVEPFELQRRRPVRAARVARIRAARATAAHDSRAARERARVLRRGEAQRREPDARAYRARDRAEPRRARRVRQRARAAGRDGESHERGAPVVLARGSPPRARRSRTT